MLRDELHTAMVLSGCRTIKDINRSHLARFGQDGLVHRL